MPTTLPFAIRLLLIPFLCLFAVPAIAADKLNVLIITVDDMSADSLGAFGCKLPDTSPNIDRLAAQGMRFTQFYAGPVCSPTRANLQSGQDQARFGITQHIPGHRRPFAKLIDPAVPPQLPLDGVSLATVLENPAAPLARDALHWHLPHYHHTASASAIRRGDWKLIEFFEDGDPELYDLRADPSEQANLATRNPALAKRLPAALATWRKHVGARMPQPNPNYDPDRAAEMGKAKAKNSIP